MPKRVLIIDDDPTGVALMESRLTKAGYVVLIERDGEAGLRRVRQDRTDAIVLDIEMPKMNGYTFILEMKKDSSIAVIPVIVQTAHQENRAIFARKGIMHYLVKPINFDLLLSKLKELLGE